MNSFEDYPATKEGGIAFVRDIFQHMGGTVRDSSLIDFEDAYCENGMYFHPNQPMTRPRKSKVLDDACLAGFEHECLRNHWDSSV